MSKNHPDLSFLRASLDELESYLLSKELFWSVSTPVGVHAFPKLTLGNLLLAIRELKAQSSPDSRDESAQIIQNVEKIRNKWTTAWQNKAEREFSSRLRQWRQYLNDLNNNQETHSPYYPNEVRVRVLLELLGEAASTDEQQALSQLDMIFRQRLTPARFIWDPELQSEFPPQEFWFLYGLI